MKKISFIFFGLIVLSLLVNVSSADDINNSGDIIVIAGVILDDKNGQKPLLSSDSNEQNEIQREELKSSSVKLTPTISSHKIIGMPEKDLIKMDGESENFPTVNRKIVKKHTQVKKKKKEQLIEGYKIGRDGEDSVYVHGEIIESKNGEISGYLYGKKGGKTYIYGYKSDDNYSNSGIHARDNKNSEYILESR